MSTGVMFCNSSAGHKIAHMTAFIVSRGTFHTRYITSAGLGAGDNGVKFSGDAETSCLLS